MQLEISKITVQPKGIVLEPVTAQDIYNKHALMPLRVLMFW